MCASEFALQFEAQYKCPVIIIIIIIIKHIMFNEGGEDIIAIQDQV